MPDLLPLVTRDPATGRELIVTRLESPTSGVTIEGKFTLGWIGRLTPEQLDFVGLLLRHRNNVQKLANELGVAYNTARARLDDIVTALGGTPEPQEEQPEPSPERREILDKLASGEITFDDALSELRNR